MNLGPSKYNTLGKKVFYEVLERTYQIYHTMAKLSIEDTPTPLNVVESEIKQIRIWT